MRRLAPGTGSRFITVYASSSIEPRKEWYANLGHQVVDALLYPLWDMGVSLGHQVVDVTGEHIRTGGGFVSEHFTQDRLRSLVGECDITSIGDIAYLVRT